MSDHEERIRELAYRLWEEAGRPDGRDDDFWHAANELTAAQDVEAEAAPPAAPVPPPSPEPVAPPAKAAPPAAAPKAKPVAARAAAVNVDKPVAGPRKPPAKKS
jgi:hypothetical protein